MVVALPERVLAACLSDVVRPSIVDSLDQNCVFARKTAIAEKRSIFTRAYLHNGDGVKI